MSIEFLTEHFTSPLGIASLIPLVWLIVAWTHQYHKSVSLTLTQWYEDKLAEGYTFNLRCDCVAEFAGKEIWIGGYPFHAFKLHDFSVPDMYPTLKMRRRLNKLVKDERKVWKKYRESEQRIKETLGKR